jgi:mannose-6-phosphate isomerase-like protein (cupin superfamily)
VRRLVLGLDADGRSCVAEECEVEFDRIDALPGASMATLFATSQSPPPPCEPGLGTLVPDQIAPGLVRWFVIDHEPRTSSDDRLGSELHHRNAIDLVVVLEGDGELILGDGPHPVHTGDCIVMAGLDHTLRPGPTGCRLISLAIGTPPPD